MGLLQGFLLIEGEVRMHLAVRGADAIEHGARVELRVVEIETEDEAVVGGVGQRGGAGGERGGRAYPGLAAWWRVLTARLGERLLRCKGLIRIADTGEVVFIQGVQKVFHRPERLPVWPDADPRSRIVCIARDTSAEEIRNTLAALQRPAGSAPDSATV